MPDTVPAMLEPGEFVIRKDAAEKIGMKNLEMLNNADRLESGTSAIDELIALSTLSGSQQMMGGGNVKKMPQSGYMQEGGSVDDPLEIDMRQRSNNVQAIGVARPDSDERILKDLARMQEDISLLQFVKPRYPKASSFNEYRRMKEESGDMMSMDEMMEVLNRAAGATQNKFKVKGYDNGGQVYSYGSGETSVPTLADLYEQMGVQPIDKQKERFESLFTYDPSREETIVDEFQSGVESLREGAGRQLGQARMASEASGAGFAGFGERDRMMSNLSMDIENKATRGLESARRGLFEDIRTQRDRYMSDAIGGLSELERAEGTTISTPQQPPENPGMIFEIKEGADGRMYRFTFNGWEYYSG
tara:strand:+ start:5381 stop:6463 length:1083 start_codon:yes stop_codon:yes gene_type:complete